MLNKMDNDKIRTPQQEASQVLRFLVGHIPLCAPLHEIERVLPLMALQKIPDVPHFIVGMLRLGNRNLVVLDLGERLSIPRENPYDLDTPVIIANAGGVIAGVIVDDILGVERVESGNLELETMIGPGVPPVKGVHATEKGAMLLLDMERVLSFDFSLTLTDLEFPPEILASVNQGE